MHYEHWMEYLEYVRSYERKYIFETPTERIKTFKEMFGYEITKSLNDLQNNKI